MTISKGNLRSGAVFSDCERYRYVLWRDWHTTLIRSLPKCVAFIGLNPSTATHEQNDPTVTRCINYAKAWGFDAMYMLNLFAFRATDPKVMKAEQEPTGFENDRFILDTCDKSSMIVCAWGTHGKHAGRSQFLSPWLEGFYPAKLHALTLTKDGQPGHPLYLPSKLKPRKWYVKDGLLGNELPFGE